jgi:hypothetical protein
MCQRQDDDVRSWQSEILALLDERYRLREDPERRFDLHLTHQRLRERLRQLELDESPG